jgi:hypothetical protein
MTDKQETKVRKNAYKYYDEIVFENQDWSKREISLSSFYAGADYVLKNKHELQEVRCLAEFLARKGILIEFITNVCAFSNECSINYIERTLEGTICEAFSWSDSPQGFDYWSKINDEYNRIK